MRPKNTICLWFDNNAQEAARFYAATFPDSKVTAVHKAPSDHPSGKAGDELTVEFTVAGIPCVGVNGGPTFKHSEAVSFQIATDPTSAAALGAMTFTAWTDGRYNNTSNPLAYQAFGQALDAAGAPYWDDAENPTIVSAPDVAHDQGGFVRVNWDRSVADAPGADEVAGHRVWRSVPASIAAKLQKGGARMNGERFTVNGRVYLYRLDAYWEMVGEQPAVQLDSYALTVPTSEDSTALSSANESFMVEAHDDTTHIWWSAVLTTHSVDNLAPPAPNFAAGYYNGGATTLYWGGVTVPDLLQYEIFAGSSPGFTPSDANRVGTTNDVTFTAAGGPAWFRIAARDIHGNLGASALVLPSGTADPACSSRARRTSAGAASSHG